MDPKVIGVRIRAYRKLLGMSQEELADLLGVARGQVNYYENGSRKMSIDKLELFCDIVGIDMDALFSDAHIEPIFSTAFRSDTLTVDDLKSIAVFRRIIANYLKIERISNGTLD